MRKISIPNRAVVYSAHFSQKWFKNAASKPA